MDKQQNAILADFYRSVGVCFELLAHSDTHKGFQARRYLNLEIYQPIWCNQYRFYVNESAQNIGFVTWGWLTPETLTDMKETGRALFHHEWRQGEQLFFNDFVAPWGGVKQILQDMTGNVFPSETANSFSRYKDGSVKKVGRWIGKEVSKGQADAKLRLI